MTKEDQAFYDWWKQNRLREKRWVNQLSVGLPIGLVFCLPVLLMLLFRGWYKRMPYVSGSQLTVILIGCIAIAVFFAVFRMRFKWDRNEQRFRELELSIQSEQNEKQEL